MFRSRWAAIGAAVAVTLGAGGVSLTQAALDGQPKPVFVALAEPCRVIDTRGGDPIAAGETNALTVQITGENGDCVDELLIPATAVGVATNVTAIRPGGSASGRSFFTVYPADASLPDTSNLNFVNGQPPSPNKVDVGLSAAGQIKIYNDEGTAHAAVDIFGYYTDHTHDGRYYTEPEIDALLDGVPTDAALAAKANTADVYTKTETDDALAEKPTRTGRIAIPASAFRSLDSGVEVNVDLAKGAYIASTTGAEQLMVAPLSLPFGSIITSVTYRFIDNSAEDLEFDLSESSLFLPFEETLPPFSTQTSGTSENVRSLEISGLSYEVLFAYGLAFTARSTNWVGPQDDLTVKGVTVEYTLP